MAVHRRRWWPEPVVASRVSPLVRAILGAWHLTDFFGSVEKFKLTWVKACCGNSARNAYGGYSSSALLNVRCGRIHRHTAMFCGGGERDGVNRWRVTDDANSLTAILWSGINSMANARDIKAAIVRNEDKIRQRPATGRLTKSTKARIRDGLTCEIEDGPWKLTADMRKSLGGNNEGPDPGVLGRAAIGSCLAIGYAIWFARLDVPLDGVEVEVEADFDYAGVLGVSDVSAGYSELRYSVNVDSPASRNDITRVLDKADAHSPWLTNMKTSFKPRRTVRISRPVE